MIIEAKTMDLGKRFDIFLKDKLDGYSRSLINKLIKEEAITYLDNMPIKPSSLIKGQEVFKIFLPKKESTKIVSVDLPLEILYSDEHIAVINKPKGLTVHPGAKKNEITLCHGLLFHFPNMEIGLKERPGIVHRLDKNTSGLMIIAKTQKAHNKISEDFKNRKIKKTYTALAWGNIEKDNFELKTGHVRHPYNRLKFFTRLSPPNFSPNSHNRLAHTSFSIKKRKFGLTEITATLHTGRTHQIRAHLADIGHPLVGDILYGANKDLPKEIPCALKQYLDKYAGQALHASNLEFFHPIADQKLVFDKPICFLPDENLENSCLYI